MWLVYHLETDGERESYEVSLRLETRESYEVSLRLKSVGGRERAMWLVYDLETGY